MTQIMAIGTYHGMDEAALSAELDALAIRSLKQLPPLGEATRAKILGVAYKGHLQFTGEMMDLLPNLRLIAKYGVGYDSIDVDSATERGIVVTNTPDVLSDDVADLTVGMWIAAGREMEAGINAVRSGSWARSGPPLAHKVSGRRVGILGLGRIGREIADRLVAFKCRIDYFARSPRDTPGWTYHDDPMALAEAVDDLIVAVPGGRETEKLVTAEMLRALGPDGIFVNISRGSVVDEEALIAALEGGVIRAAALDVFLNEPHVDPRLASMKNVLPLPHIGTATVETRNDMGVLQRKNLHEMLAGRPAVTPVNA
ncbi:2-hydroxyacid dehydrogenase [Pararhodobacter sp. SW119]|uniref:2-hydroxyacid dehydrogenase n=1 Tax=Pararhodobacter sp. SW119 TaxID=2780075 RepID=UPI001ADFE4FF|nr:2-hydroxyacid dehydrogenase [Pararhodobacter sp. SW119]